MNLRSIFPLLTIALLGQSSHGGIDNPITLQPPNEPHGHSKSGGRGGYSPKKTNRRTGYMRPSKARRPETRFHRLNVFRNKFNLWNEKQLES